MAIPDDRRYTESHEWHKPEGENVAIGLSQFAVDELTDITFLELLKSAGDAVARGETIGEIESVKATSEVYSGLAGEVIEVNPAVTDDPSLINEDPYEKGWMIKIRPSDASQLDQLMDAQTYEQQAG